MHLNGRKRDRRVGVVVAVVLGSLLSERLVWKLPSLASVAKVLRIWEVLCFWRESSID